MLWRRWKVYSFSGSCFMVTYNTGDAEAIYKMSANCFICHRHMIAGVYKKTGFIKKIQLKAKAQRHKRTKIRSVLTGSYPSGEIRRKKIVVRNQLKLQRRICLK